MWRNHPSCIRSWSVLITCKSSESSKEVHLGSIEAFAKLLFVTIANVKRSTLSLLILLPITTNSLDRWTSPSSVSRPYDAMTSLCHRFPQPYSRRRDRTGWPLSSSVLSTPDTRMVKWPLQPRSGYKREPFAQNRLSSLSSPFLFFLQLVLATLPLEHLFCSSPSKLFFCLRPWRREKAQSRPKEELKPSCHPWLRLRKSLSRFAGHC
jgi:hypothetical protein